MDIDKIDSEYLKSIVSLDNTTEVTLFLFEDILKLLIEDKIDELLSLDREYAFNGLSYFGCMKTLNHFLDEVKKI